MDLENESFGCPRRTEQSIQEQVGQHDKMGVSPVQTPNLKQFVYSKTKSFWLDKLNQAIQKNKLPDPQQTKPSPPKITQVIKDGLELQDYMQKYTNFFKLYLQEIKPNFVQFNTRKKRFVPQAKLMLKIFIQKNKNAVQYFYDRLNWVEHRLTAYCFVVDEKLCIKYIMEKLVQNKYEQQEDFYLEMSNMFDGSLLFNFHNPKMKEIVLRLKENWEVIKLKVLQLYNFGTQSFINPEPEMQPEMMDINAQINLLKRKVSIWNSKVEELDYDPLYFEKNGGERTNNLMSRESQESKRKETGRRKKDRPKFESGSKRVQTVSRDRMLQLKKDLSKRINEEFQSREKSSKKLMQYIKENSKRNPNFIGQNNEINLESLSVDEFINLQSFVQKITIQ